MLDETFSVIFKHRDSVSICAVTAYVYETDGFRAAAEKKILMWVLSCIFPPFDRRYYVERVRNRLFS